MNDKAKAMAMNCSKVSGYGIFDLVVKSSFIAEHVTVHNS